MGIACRNEQLPCSRSNASDTPNPNSPGAMAPNTP